jgi:hypothetical protein
LIGEGPLLQTFLFVLKLSKDITEFVLHGFTWFLMSHLRFDFLNPVQQNDGAIFTQLQYKQEGLQEWTFSDQPI